MNLSQYLLMLLGVALIFAPVAFCFVCVADKHNKLNLSLTVETSVVLTILALVVATGIYILFHL